MITMPHLPVVDDDRDMLTLQTAFFRKHGHAVSIAEDRRAPCLRYRGVSKRDQRIYEKAGLTGQNWPENARRRRRAA